MMPKGSVLFWVRLNNSNNHPNSTAAATWGEEVIRTASMAKSLEGQVAGLGFTHNKETSQLEIQIEHKPTADTTQQKSTIVLDDIFSPAAWKSAQEKLSRAALDLQKAPAADLIAIPESGHTIHYTTHANFTPVAQVRAEPSPLPEAVREYITESEHSLLFGDNPNENMYRNSVKELNWEYKLKSFVTKFLKEREPTLLGTLGIKDINCLTPEQAINLSTAVVLHLTRYSKVKLTLNSPADYGTVFSLFQTGEQNLYVDKNKDFMGNGVCWHMAQAAKLVFEALKATQGYGGYHQLHDTYVLYQKTNHLR